MSDVRLIRGDCAEELRKLPDASFDLVLTDPPYPCIRRSYGTWTEAEWWALMRAVVPECMRVLKPTGSAVFVLQPNSERVGRMRTWLWEFMAWVGKEWGIVQDAWWWNHCALPEAHAIQGRLLRPSLKACVWIGPGGCFREQEAVLWEESQENAGHRASAKAFRVNTASGQGTIASRARSSCLKRGGTTPFNVIPVGGNHANGASHGHGASTPLPLCSWWTRYLCPPGGAVLDPFMGSGTVGLAALKHGASFTGIERVPEYVDIARRRIDEARASAKVVAA